MCAGRADRLAVINGLQILKAGRHIMFVTKQEVGKAVGIIAGLVLIAISCTPKAHAAPYGGCDEAWQAPTSAGAQTCRDHGWTVTSHLVLDQHAVVRWTNLVSCHYEDASSAHETFPCGWNMPPGGGHDGLTMYYTGTWRHHRAHYVWAHGHPAWVSHHRDRHLDRAYHSRDWTVCFKSHGWAHCPNGKGYRLTW